MTLVRLAGWLLLAAAAAAVLLISRPAAGATVSGTVQLPVADGGFAPDIYATALGPARVRVVGTDRVADVVAVDRQTGTFTLTNVPTGPVTLLYVEQPDRDVFTMASRRLDLDVAGDLTGVKFALEHHWKYLPSYPPPWRNAAYDMWEPFFVSDKIGFLMLRNRGVSPMVTELWRTTSGGVGWKKIGNWPDGDAGGWPDMTGRSMLFSNAYKGVLVGRFGWNGATVGVLRTADGGTTWTGVDFPNVPDANGLISIGNFAALGLSSWIACGSENTGTYMGSGSPFAFTIWETTDGGATWAIKRTWREDSARCSALGTNASGKAILFATPYAFGGGMHRELRDPSGVWTQQPGNDLVVNSGYGTADVSMVGNEAWASATRESPTGPGLFYSRDAGVTWNKIFDGSFAYHDFVTPLRGFAIAGGAYTTYDGGLTWLLQSAGGGICCHGNYIWATDALRAIWAEGGVGDPNGKRDVFTYYEPRVPSFEVLAGAGIPNATVEPGSKGVRVASYRFVNNGPVPLEITSLTMKASGSGEDRLDVNVVRAWWDRDGDGVVEADDPQLASGSYAIDDGLLTLDLGATYLVHPRVPFHVMVTYDFAAGIAGPRTYGLTVTPSTVAAATADGGSLLTVNAAAPTGTTLGSATVTVQSSVPALASFTLSKASLAGCLSVTGTIVLTAPAPAGGVVVATSDTLANATTPASVTVAAGATKKAFTIRTSAVSATQSGAVRASLQGQTLQQPLALNPIGLSLLTLTPATVQGGASSSGVAKLQCVAGPGDIVVTLSSSKPSSAAPSVPSVRIPAGAQTGAFVVTTSPLTVGTTAKITALANGVSKVKTLTITP